MSTVVRIALFQANTGIDPDKNAEALDRAADQAAEGGAMMLFTPEMSNLLDRDRERAGRNLASERDDRVLAAMREAAARTGLWISLGSFAFVNADGSRANRAVVIDPTGETRTSYDKIHMF
ncbi:MAG: nitrilase-related carbon-nitrogen hydrolase, partial [Pseudomonadota bacterium]|nr:nitrilase-related carbon-nitrogen hydrolase [Pseudomonadota bacterium]